MESEFSSVWRRAALGYTIGRVTGQGLEFLGWLLLVRELHPQEYGHLAVAFLVARYVGLAADWGGTLTGARDSALPSANDKVRSLVGHRRRLGVVGTLLFAATCSVAGFTDLSPVGLTIASAGLSRDWISLGQGKHLGAVLPALTRGAVFVVATQLVSTPLQAAWVVGLAAMAGGIISVAITPQPAPSSDLSEALGLPSFWPVVAVLAAQVYISTDTVLLAVQRSATDAGIYAAVYRIPLAWITIVGLIVQPITPLIARIRADSRRMRQALLSLRKPSAIGVGIIMLSAAIVYATFDRVYPSDYHRGLGPVLVLLAATAVSSLSAPWGAVLLGLGQDRRYALVILVGAAINVSMNLVLIPEFGLYAASVTTLLTEAIVLILVVTGVRSSLETKREGA